MVAVSPVTISEFAAKFPGKLTLGCDFSKAAAPLASKGWKVFPIKPRGKTPLTAHGVLDASADLTQISEWATKWPMANIGLATGDLVVVDVDPRHGGNESLAALESKHGQLPQTLEAKTGGGGRHLFFLAEGATIRNSAGKLGPGLDARGQGGYVCVPPSVHELGTRYEWTRRVAPVPMPGWVRARLSEPEPYPLANGNGHARIPQGQRNVTLTSLAGTMRKRGMSPAAIEAALLEENQTRCTPTPLSDTEVRNIAQSVSRYPAAPEKVSAQTSNTESPKVGQKPSDRSLPFKTALQISQETPVETEYICTPYIVKGGITEVGGKVKLAGKTTWMTHLCRAVVLGKPFMGYATMRTPVVYLTEQPSSSWRLALERAGLLTCADFHCLYFRDVYGLEWSFVVDQAVIHCKKVGASLLVVDTLGQFAGISGDSENNSGDALKAMQPLQMAASEGIAVMASRHERKSGGAVGESGRGSSAFSGAVDIVLSIRRPEGKHRKTLRTIEAISRFDGTPDEMTIELTDAGYIALGTSVDVESEEAARHLLSAAPGSDNEAVELKVLIEGSEISRSTAQRVVRELCSKGLMCSVGEGKRGSPFRYFLPQIVSAQTSNMGLEPLGRNEGEWLV
jgi:hypothetical protein